MENYSIEYYEKENGERPAESFILSLDNKLQAKLFMSLELLEMKGPYLREPYSKAISNGIFELRAKQGSNISRVLYFFISGKKIILTNGFIKKTQRTPTEEIRKAMRYRDDYLSREER